MTISRPCKVRDLVLNLVPNTIITISFTSSILIGSQPSSYNAKHKVMGSHTN